MGDLPGIRGGRRAGGILSLVQLIDKHRAALEYDWRNRLHLALSEVGRSMSWGEAVRQLQTLAADPSTRIAAALGGYKHPWSQEWEVLTNLYDLTQNAHRFRNPKPYPRPWRDPSANRYGHTTKSRAEVISILNARGHKIAN